MLINNAAQNCETTYKGPFVITHYWTNCTVIIQCGEKNIGHNIFCINPYTYDTTVEDITF